MPKISWANLRAKRNLDNNPQELLGPLITGQNHDGSPFVLPTEPVDTASLALANGEAWAAGAQLGLGASQVGQLLLMNPADSGRNVIIRAHTISCDQGTMAVRYINDPNVSTGTLVDPVNANQAYQGSGLTSKVQCRFGIGLIASPTFLPLFGRVGSGLDFERQWIFLVPPGQGFGIQVTAPSGLGATASVEANALWLEQPV